MEIKCNKCGEMCEFDPEEYGHMTWCGECNDYPQADIQAAFVDHISTIADQAKDKAKYGDA